MIFSFLLISAPSFCCRQGIRDPLAIFCFSQDGLQVYFIHGAPLRGQQFIQTKFEYLTQLEVSIGSGFLGSQSKMASFYDHVGELQFGGCFPIDYFFHSVSTNQPNNFNRLVLANAMSPGSCLQVILRIKVTVNKNHSICCC
uniref:cDNA FLJ59079 n=1 Tax=Homo sapiens TaxID=9606 RepID=B7Z8D1_HUMAN|nr:unnamed protein product [Homo sapiens]